MKILYKLVREEIYGLCSAGEHIMDNVMEFLGSLGELRGVGHGVRNDGCVARRQGEVFGCEFVDNRVDFHDCGINSMFHQSSGRCPDSKTTVIYQPDISHVEGDTYITKAFVSLSGTLEGVSTSRTASSITNTP